MYQITALRYIVELGINLFLIFLCFYYILKQRDKEALKIQGA